MRRQLLAGAAFAVIVIVVLLVTIATNNSVFSLVGSGLFSVSNGLIGTDNEEVAHAAAGDQDDSVCEGCHADMRNDETPWHRMHLEQSFTNFTCSLCHKEIKKVERSMDGKILIDRTLCPQCHRVKFPAFNEDHQSADWIKRHKTLRGDKRRGEKIPNMEELESEYPQCFVCHRRKELSFCKTCHEFHPHNVDWIKGGHGRAAQKTDFECLRCHEKTTWCTDECHEGVTLPHNIPKWSQHWEDEPDAPKWRKIHYKEASRLTGTPLFTTTEGNRLDPGTCSVCRRCHDSDTSTFGRNPDFCMQCHPKRFYDAFPDELGVPWWESAMPFVKRNGADRCWECHQPEFCVACHTTGTKAQPGTTFVGWPD